MVFPCKEGAGGDGRGVGAQIDAAQEGALFAEGGKREGFGARGEENGEVVPEDTGKDLCGARGD